MTERLPPTHEETLLYELSMAERQIKAAIDAAAKGGIEVEMLWHGSRSHMLTHYSSDWLLRFTKELHFPTEATP